MIFFTIVIILFQIGVAFFLAQKNTKLKEEIAREKLIIEGKENQIVKLKNAVKGYESKIQQFRKKILNIKNFENLHNEIKFPVAEMEDGTGLLITRRCKNDCIIESHEFPNYEAGVMVSKALTDMGFKMEKEFCRDCKRDGSAASDEDEFDIDDLDL